MDRLFTANEKLARFFSEKIDGWFGPERNGAGVGQEFDGQDNSIPTQSEFKHTIKRKLKPILMSNIKDEILSKHY